MKALPRTQFGNPILRAKARKVPPAFLNTAEFKALVRVMFLTMKQAGGVGLAAPQIDIPLQLAVIEVAPTKLRPKLARLPKTVIINPRILSYSKEQVGDWEGCLSFPDVRGKAVRSVRINVEYLDEHGTKVVRQLSGFPARVFQHEIDHLNGVVYVDRMKDMKTLMTLGEFRKRILKLK